MMFVGSKYLFLFHMPLVNDFMLELVNEIGKSMLCDLNLSFWLKVLVMFSR